MLEDCSDLQACEERLSPGICNMTLLGDLPLSSGDVDHLASLMGQCMSTTAGRRSLARESPACLCCFLVWKGITGYSEGDYWSAVWQAIDLTNDANRERRWGQAFLDFLDANSLPHPEISGAHRYVTPILLHGGIPDSCLEEFFGSVLLPIAQRLYDPTDREEVAHELSILRQDDRDREELEKQIRDLRGQARDLKKRLEHTRWLVQAYDDVARLWEIEAYLERYLSMAAVPDNWEAIQEVRRHQSRSLETRIAELEKEKRRRITVIERFSRQDRAVLARSSAIERACAQSDTLRAKQSALGALEGEERSLVRRLEAQSAGVFAKPWQDQWGEVLCHLPLEALKTETEAFEVIATRERQQRRALADLKASTESSLRTRMVTGLACSAVGVASILLGICLDSVWPWIVPGTCYTATGCVVGFSWHRARVHKRAERKALEQALRDTINARQGIRAGICDLVPDLPVSWRLLQNPSSALHAILAPLTQTYLDLRECRSDLARLRQDTERSGQRIQQLAAAVGVDCGSEVTGTLSSLHQLLREARDRQTAAASAKRDLTNTLCPELASLGSRLRSIQHEMAASEDQVAVLGDGDVRLGLERLRTLRQSKEEAKALRTDLQARREGFDALEPEVRTALETGRDKSFFEGQIKCLERQIEATRTEKDALEHDLAYYPHVFPGVDEPIRRYLLCAGSHAEGLLAGCLRLLHVMSTTGDICEVECEGVPERVMRALDCWWSQHVHMISRPEEEVDAATGQRFRVPTILLDPGMAEIMVRFPAQRYLASAGGTSPRLRVVAALSDAVERTVALRAYDAGEGLLNTQDLQFPLPIPANQYEFILESDDLEIHRWEVHAGRNGVSYMAFEGTSGRLIRDDHLPATRVWLVSKCVSVTPSDCVLEDGGALWGEWSDYDLHLVGLDQVGELCITDDAGRLHLIPVSREKACEPALVDGERLTGVLSDGVEVYAGSLPRVRIPAENAAELRQWRISVLPEKGSSPQERRHHRLGDLVDVTDLHLDKGWIDLSLADEELLGPCPFGSFSVRLHRPPRTTWFCTFCILPCLEIGFDREVYFPTEEREPQDVFAMITLASGMEFVPQSPTWLCERKDNAFAVGVKGGEERLKGIICWCRGDETRRRIPVTIDIPKLTWRLRGVGDDESAEWGDMVEELWFGDWETASELQVIVRLPSSMDGQVALRLESSTIDQSRALLNGTARFELLRYGDELRSGSSSRTFMLRLPDGVSGTAETPLFKVQTRWEVVNVQCVQRLQDGMIVLSITWAEKGRTDGKARVLRLWKITDTVSRALIEKNVLDAGSTTLRIGVLDLPPGRYTLQFDLEDSWATSVLSPPAPEAPNTLVIEVVHAADTWEGRTVCLRSVWDQYGRGYDLSPKGAYRIEIKGRIVNRELPSGLSDEGVLVTRTNEGWYVGDFAEADDADLNASLSRANPVKFEYDAISGRITAIEDRSGDGAMFCRDCWRLYWSQEVRSECREHNVFGPAETFKVSWEP